MSKTKEDFHRDLMVTDDDAGCLHWRAACCQHGCVQFFDGNPYATVQWLYQPWREMYEKAP